MEDVSDQYKVGVFTFGGYAMLSLIQMKAAEVMATYVGSKMGGFSVLQSG